jgi:acetoin utilization deacetylase AcuC-like enzyme
VFRPDPFRLVHDPAYRTDVRGVPLDPLRADRILAFLLDAGLTRQGDVSRPRPASLKYIARAHSGAYLDSLDRPEVQEAVFGFPLGPEDAQRAIDYQRLLVGGTIHATRLALRTGQVGVNLGGGLHHATPERGMGFCLFNDIVVAVTRLRAKGFDEPVLVVDLDLHDGNGTRAAFAHDASVFTFSIHNETWDDSPAVADRRIPLGSGVTGERYLATLRAELPRVVREHRPGLVVYVAGADPGQDDPLGDWNVAPADLLDRDRFVIEQVRAVQPATPVVVLLGGGYGDRAWRCTARFLAWLASGKRHEPSEDIDAVVRMFHRIEREAGPSSSADGGWALTEEDLGELSAEAERGVRLLGSLSKHAVELSLERFGFLGRIRSLGFTGLELRIEATPPVGQTMRLVADWGRGPLLMEQRLDRNRSALPGAELLAAEWLLLQNPAAAFPGTRPPLPGQRHPGLGLLREVVAWWILLCERLRLDGILFVPSHYYMAVLGRRHLRFLRAEDAATFEAFARAVDGSGLTEASRAIEQGHVVDRATGRSAVWPAPPMVLPVSRALKERARSTAGVLDREVPDFRRVETPPGH